MLNRTRLDQVPANCPGCLVGSQFMRPAEQGVYQFIYFYSIESPLKAAESNTFRVAAPADVCGVCGGNGRACAGCDGVPNSGTEYDLCGVCGGSNMCVGCDGIPFSNARLDVCGVCKGNGKSCMGCDGIARPGGGLKVAFPTIVRSGFLQLTCVSAANRGTRVGCAAGMIRAVRFRHLSGRSRQCWTSCARSRPLRSGGGRRPTGAAQTISNCARALMLDALLVAMSTACLRSLSISMRVDVAQTNMVLLVALFPVLLCARAEV
eukprot:2812211-Rhodomonas_salina.2